ncbi:hypothetical protein FGADI_1987 [Fusarium gaditjirri]|uniref:TauD/TfdA-like domain-containing protein n=1 Tax=Fusarium gaditjirri TaxID=282569 RepID=A0A8H4TJY4_9HYPO|nr:hypothetical protein FGADI_1987 [Fusarium gaditjirri]
MHRVSRLTRFGTIGPTSPHHVIRSHGTLQHSPRVLDASHISWARHPKHVSEVAAELQTSGLLKIRLGFPDDSCDYLRDLILSMHKQQGHHLPISHSATRGWFWDVRPKPVGHTGAYHARSETMSEFSWHTDCSYEDPLPRYFALQVLQHDRYGGGTLSAMNVASLIGFLSPETRKALMAPEFRMEIPPEFIKDPAKSFITGSILAPDPPSTIIRYRHDIIAPLTTRGAKALEELSAVLVRREVQASSTVHLRSSDLPKGSIILMDNRRWMHARNEIKDPERHLRRTCTSPVILGGCWALTRVSEQPLPETFDSSSHANSQYPPDENAIRDAREEAAQKSEQFDLTAWPLFQKRDLYTVVERLINDTNPRNTYRHNVYTSVTGGGGGVSKPLFFATDALENRRHRALFGEFLKRIGIIERGDWVLSTHHGGNLYRSLDLTLEILENAGASVLAAGHQCPPATAVQILQDFNVNVLTGDSSQIISIAHQIATMSEMSDKKKRIKIRKVIYTSEGLSITQRRQIYKALGPVAIYSLIGSAEAGPYGASSPSLMDLDPYSNSNDFVIDTRMTIIEILPLSCMGSESDGIPETLPDGESGVIAQTVLTRLRHPVVRYITGDIGSLHPLPKKAVGRIAKHDLCHYRILRLRGRDHRFSFMWDGCDFQFDKLNDILSDPMSGVLLWQVILDKMQPSQEISLEIRLLSGQRSEGTVQLQPFLDRLKAYLDVSVSNEHKFKITFVNDVLRFELSRTGQKVIRFVDHSL